MRKETGARTGRSEYLEAADTSFLAHIMPCRWLLNHLCFADGPGYSDAQDFIMNWMSDCLHQERSLIDLLSGECLTKSDLFSPIAQES